MNREQANELLRQYIKNERMLNHCYASEAVLRALAVRLNQDEEKWGLAGLLHDLDVEVVNADPLRHGLETARILTGLNVDPDIVEAIKLHNEMATGIERTTQFQYALAAGETITGLIVATALVYPDKKLASVKVSSVTKRVKEKAFAASVNREKIYECETIGLTLEEFVAVSLEAMKGISERLGL
ncbi:MAG: HD domain-containing protein [Bacteroidetes bacterium]|nr:HD domain-containing protein [Bacteroidota bacterium]